MHAKQPGYLTELRPAKNAVNPWVPYHFLHETEPGKNGEPQAVNTIFLTGKECAFKCLMCDLWKNTLDFPAPEGAIVKQLDFALRQLPEAQIIKLYNSSNFFDPKAVPVSEYSQIADRLNGTYRRVIVENHPKLTGNLCLTFSEMLEGKLEIAMGLESIHPEVVTRLNKQMQPEDFRKATGFLKQHDIDVRAFILLNPPYLTPLKENINWTIRAVEYAFDSGADTCAIIPTRTGNGIMERLQAKGHYQTPQLSTLETVMEECLALHKGIVLTDTWDISGFSDCTLCFTARKERLDQMNLQQNILPRITCTCEN